MRSLPPIIALLSGAALVGCTQSPSRYPSLLPRPAETQSLDEPVRPLPVATPDPAFDTRIAETTASLDSMTKAFNASAQNAEAKVAVARGLPAGSERWLDAQAALADLATLRGPILTIVADLEQLAIERGAAGQPPYPALDAAVARANALSDAQQDRMGALEAALSGA
jgi:hypothetical protein